MLKSLELATQTSCLNRAADDEPVFVLRANDENAPAIVCTWARDYLESKGGYANAAKVQIAKYEEAIQLASQMRVWRMQQVKAG
jgi:hypothetical protein